MHVDLFVSPKAGDGTYKFKNKIDGRPKTQKAKNECRNMSKNVQIFFKPKGFHKKRSSAQALKHNRRDKALDGRPKTEEGQRQCRNMSIHIQEYFGFKTETK